MTGPMVYSATVSLWGFAATIVMTTIMLGGQGLGLSRLSLPFLFGSAVTTRLRATYVLGYLLYAAGGWLFAFVYDALFVSIGFASWWLGAAIGALHGLFLLAGLMHLPLVHPRMVSDYDRPRTDRAIEPPGFLGLYYGRQTPAIAMVAHVVYGAILGAALHVA